MATNLFVGNLPYTTDDSALGQMFAEAGTVVSAKVIMDKFSGKSRGFGFVEMPNDSEATAAIAGLNGKDLKGRALIVNEARPREERPRDGGGRRPGGSGGYGDRDKRGGSSGGGKRRF